MLNVGLTGGIACGKSTVANIFVALGAYLIDFDKLAHEAQETGKPAWKEIVNYFGDGILNHDDTINRNRLAQIVFMDKRKLEALNNIVHPLVFNLWQERLDKIKIKEEHAIVLADIPLLFEGKMQNLFDLTILVAISPEEQICRLMARNDLSRDDAQIRLKNQMPIADKIGLADIVIDNSGDFEQAEKKVAEIWQQLKGREENKDN
ncbi:MAG: dephospho-CoA kinase [Deltaproteobacteria bacterium]